MHNLKVKNYMLLGRQTEDSSPDSSISDSSKRLNWKTEDTTACGAESRVEREDSEWVWRAKGRLLGTSRK